MAHYAFLNSKNIVVSVIVGNEQMMMAKDSGDLENQIRDLKNQKNQLPIEEQLTYDEQIDDLYTQIENLPEVEVDKTEYWEEYYGGRHGLTCKRTSYNTQGGVHQNGGTPFRKNYAGIGYTYDSVRDAFYAPQPYESWTLNEDTCLWEAPVAYPENENLYLWDEESLKWILAE